MPKTKAERKEERTRLLALYTDECESINVIKLTGVRIDLRFYNSPISFEWKSGRTQMIPNGRRIAADDYAFLFTFSDMLMKAVRVGYKKNNEETSKKKRRLPSTHPPKTQLRLML